MRRSTLPTEIGAYPALGTIDGVVVADHYAYVAAWFAGLQVMDVSDPAAPVEVGFYDTAGTAQDVRVADGTIYVADGLVILQFAPPVSTP